MSFLVEKPRQREVQTTCRKPPGQRGGTAPEPRSMGSPSHVRPLGASHGRVFTGEGHAKDKTHQRKGQSAFQQHRERQFKRETGTSAPAGPRAPTGKAGPCDGAVTPRPGSFRTAAETYTHPEPAEGRPTQVPPSLSTPASTLAHSYQVARRQLSHGGSAGLGMESGKPAQTASPLLRARKRCSHRLRPVPSSVKSSEDAGKRFILPSRDWRTRFHGPFLKGRRRETHADPRGEARRRSGSPRAPPSARGTRSTAAGGGAVITVY